MYDLIIKNGKIYDGSGNPPYFADVAVTDGKIVKVAKNLRDAAKVIDASGLAVSPGFVDSHSHSDASVLSYPDQPQKPEQGITTSIGGQCGSSVAPISQRINEEKITMVGNFGKNTEVYRTMGTLIKIAENVPQGANIALIVGHGALRNTVMGKENRAPSAEELEQMKELLREALEAGAFGLSFGLIYSPGCFADTDELVSLAKVVAEYGGVITAHMRNEGDDLIKATEEIISIARASGARTVISHHKAFIKDNWGKVHYTLQMVDEANEEGLEIYCDVYPYLASSTLLSARFIPKEYLDRSGAALAKALDDPEIRQKIVDYNRKKWGNDVSWALITLCQAHPEYAGRYLSEIAESLGADPFETACDIIRDCRGLCRGCYFCISESDMMTVLAHPRSMVCTDSGVVSAKTSTHTYHPRLRASFPRAIGKYVREKKVVSLTEMIRKMTFMPAKVYGLEGKGLISEGFDADICIFDPDKIIDRAEFTDPSKKADGLNYVLIGGEVVVENANYNGKRMGKVLLHK